jgi:predicted MFS family arabinose efflux permease
MTASALPLLILELTGAQSQEHVLGLVAAAAALPAVLLAIPSGVGADRFDRRRLLIGSDVASGVVLAGLVALIITDHLEVPVLVVAAFVLGATAALFTAAVQPVIPSIVADHQLDEANGKLAAAADGTEFVGTPLGPLLFSINPWTPFLVDAVSFVGSARLLRTLPPQPPAESATREQSRLKPAIELVRGSPSLMRIWVALGLLSLTGGLVFTVLPIILRQQVGVSLGWYGAMMTLVAVGSTAAGIASGRVITLFGHRTTLALVIAINAVSYVVLGITERWVWAAVALTLWGASVTLGGVVTMTIRQRLIPPHLAGRTLALFQFVLALGGLLGGLAAVVLADVFDAGSMAVLAGWMQMPVLILLLRGLPVRPSISGPPPGG